MQNLACGVTEYAHLTVIGPRGCLEHLPEDATAYETSSKLMPFLLFSTWISASICRKKSFDIIIGGSGLIAPTLRILTLLYGSTTLVFLHGLDLVIDNTIYQKIFIPCIRRVSYIIANSRSTKHIAVVKGVPQDRITIVNPGTHFPEIPDDVALANFRKRHDISFDKIMIFVGRITKRKGLSRFIQHSLPAILASEPKAGLIVVGNNSDDSLNKLGEQQEVLAQMKACDNYESIVFLGQVSDSDLTACYATADVQIFPLIEVPGDIEGFGMIAIEAAACGTPTVAFNLGGVSDAISTKNGSLIPPNRYDQFSKAVIDMLITRRSVRSQCLEHAENFSWSIFNTKIKECLLKSPP